MKKQKIKSLSLSKRTVSTLNPVKGGGHTDGCFYTDNTRCQTQQECESRDPGCLTPTGISACLACFEIFTEGCGQSFLGQCPTNGNDCDTNVTACI